MSDLRELFAPGGEPPNAWAVMSGSLPPGLSLSAGGVDRWWHLRDSRGEYCPLFNNLGRDGMLGGLAGAVIGLATHNYGWPAAVATVVMFTGMLMWFFAGSPLR